MTDDEKQTLRNLVTIATKQTEVSTGLYEAVQALAKMVNVLDARLTVLEPSSTPADEA